MEQSDRNFDHTVLKKVINDYFFYLYFKNMSKMKMINQFLLEFLLIKEPWNLIDWETRIFPRVGVSSIKKEIP